MQPSTYKPYFLHTPRCMAINNCREDKARGILCLETQNAIYALNENFKELGECAKSKFDSKPAQLLLNNSKLKFNRGQLSKKGNVLPITQP